MTNKQSIMFQMWIRMQPGMVNEDAYQLPAE